MNREIILFNKNELHRIMCDDVVFVSADGDYSNLHLTTGEEICLTKQIGLLSTEMDTQLDERLSPLAQIGRSLIINMDYIHYIHPVKQILTLQDKNGKVHCLKASLKALHALKESLENKVKKGGMR